MPRSFPAESVHGPGDPPHRSSRSSFIPRCYTRRSQTLTARKTSCMDSCLPVNSPMSLQCVPLAVQLKATSSTPLYIDSQCPAPATFIFKCSSASAQWSGPAHPCMEELGQSQ
ncbi:hypothetical protein COCON_G00044150 [Conger conger]|uniref:Uncharacterized protein n=1 Tax=Conger conger TaxID=82655 RepID=A0A9Q1I4V3_CONCO|nr:hypothetical protein COCON_G00044150 [Conger conger]